MTVKVASQKYHYACGKRKTSIASVRLIEEGSGKIVVNETPIDDYFHGVLIGLIKAPLKLVGKGKDYDISVKVEGGGKASQADAVRHGISKALVQADLVNRPVLKKAGFLIRDSRIKERKKPGLKKARRAPQWAKR